MIRIQINDVQQKKQEYENALINLVAFRVSVLHQSLCHLNGVAVDFSTDDFVSFKAVTKHIINSVGDNFTILNGRSGYATSIANYLANLNSLGNINIRGLMHLCNTLLANSEQHLRSLLIDDANNLLVLNETILNNHVVNTKENIAIIKLAFDYQNFGEISEAIKIYFRANSFTKICSYCNTEPIIHQTNLAGQVIRSYELDHFYDKARYPLLSYSLFNLVASDHTCNVTNKGSTQFTDDFHLNPHHMGYIDRICFVPVGLSTAYKVDEVEVSILEVQGTVTYQRINGNNLPNVEQGDLGNLNVFRIRSKYKNEIHRAGRFLKTFHKENKQGKHLKKYFKALKTLDRKANYIKWYEEELDVRFNPSDFNDKAFSKLCRDIHDYYYNQNKSILNRYIIELIYK